MPCKVDYKDLEKITKLLDKVNSMYSPKIKEDAAKLSKMIKDKYTEIKPHYDRAN